MKLAIVGNQALDRRQGELAWVLISGLLTIWEPEMVISGGATGVDSVAEAVAKEFGYYKGNRYEGAKTFVEFLPEVQAWDPVGRKGFKARNLEIVDGCTHLVRISKHDGGNRTYGSGWTADLAEEKLGTENVFRYYI